MGSFRFKVLNCLFIMLSFFVIFGCASTGPSEGPGSSDSQKTVKETIQDYPVAVNGIGDKLYSLSYYRIYHSGSKNYDEYGFVVRKFDSNGFAAEKRISLYANTKGKRDFYKAPSPQIFPLNDGCLISYPVQKGMEGTVTCIYKMDDDLNVVWSWFDEKLAVMAMKMKYSYDSNTRIYTGEDGSISHFSFFKLSLDNKTGSESSYMVYNKLDSSGKSILRKEYNFPFAESIVYLDELNTDKNSHNMMFYFNEYKNKGGKYFVKAAVEADGALTTGEKSSLFKDGNVPVPWLVNGRTGTDALRISKTKARYKGKDSNKQLLPVHEGGDKNTQPYSFISLWKTSEMPYTLHLKKAVPLPWCGLTENEITQLDTAYVNNNIRKGFQIFDIGDFYLMLYGIVGGTSPAAVNQISGALYLLDSNLEVVSTLEIPLVSEPVNSDWIALDGLGSVVDIPKPYLDNRPRLFQVQAPVFMELMDNNRLVIAGGSGENNKNRLSVTGEIQGKEYNELNTLMVLNIDSIINGKTSELSSEMLGRIITWPSSFEHEKSME